MFKVFRCAVQQEWKGMKRHDQVPPAMIAAQSSEACSREGKVSMQTFLLCVLRRREMDMVMKRGRRDAALMMQERCLCAAHAACCAHAFGGCTVRCCCPLVQAWTRTTR